MTATPSKSQDSTASSGGFSVRRVLQSSDLQELLSLIIMLALIVGVMASLSDVFLTPRNFNNLLLFSSTIGII
ncbi:MAG: hypothetical protein AAF125_09755, partial [Chloroflexota bacterium]